MVSFDKKEQINIWENFEDVIEEDTLRNESRTHGDIKSILEYWDVKDI